MGDPKDTYDRFNKTLNNVQQIQSELKNHASDLLEQATEIATTVMPQQEIYRTVEQVTGRHSGQGGSFSGGGSSSGSSWRGSSERG